MKPNEINNYLKKKKIKDNWLEKAKQLKNVSELTLFIQKRFQEKKSQSFPKLDDITKLHKQLKPSEKRKYEIYAEEINEEREKLRNIYELIYGFKTRYPSGAYRIFLQEKAKENAIRSINEGKKLWDKLNADKKMNISKNLINLF